MLALDKDGHVGRTVRLFKRWFSARWARRSRRATCVNRCAGGAAAAGRQGGRLLAGRPADLGRTRPGPHRRVHPRAGRAAARQGGPRRRPLEGVGGGPARADRHGADRRGRLECKLEQVTTVNKRAPAHVEFPSATVSGTNEDGPTKQQLDGLYYFDLETNHLSYLSLKGRHVMLREGKEVGRIEGKFTLTAQAPTRVRTWASRPCGREAGAGTRTTRSCCTTTRTWACASSTRGAGGSRASGGVEVRAGQPRRQRTAPDDRSAGEGADGRPIPH